MCASHNLCVLGGHILRVPGRYHTRDAGTRAAEARTVVEQGPGETSVIQVTGPGRNIRYTGYGPRVGIRYTGYGPRVGIY